MAFQLKFNSTLNWFEKVATNYKNYISVKEPMSQPTVISHHVLCIAAYNIVDICHEATEIILCCKL